MMNKKINKNKVNKKYLNIRIQVRVRTKLRRNKINEKKNIG